MNYKFYKKRPPNIGNGSGQQMLPNLASSHGQMAEVTPGGVQPIGQLLQNNGVASGKVMGISLEAEG